MHCMSIISVQHCVPDMHLLVHTQINNSTLDFITAHQIPVWSSKPQKVMPAPTGTEYHSPPKILPIHPYVISL